MEQLVAMTAPLGATDSVQYGQRSYEIKDGLVHVPTDVARHMEKMGYKRVVSIDPPKPDPKKHYPFYTDPWVRPPGFTGATGATASYK